MKRFFSTFAIGVAASALFAAGNLNAVELVARNVVVPFDFTVERASLPAGEYRIEREFGKQGVYLVHAETGRRVQVMRGNGAGAAEHVTLTFVTTANGRKLTGIR